MREQIPDRASQNLGAACQYRARLRERVSSNLIVWSYPAGTIVSTKGVEVEWRVAAYLYRE